MLQTPTGRPKEDLLKPISKILAELWPLPVLKTKEPKEQFHHYTSQDRLEWVKKHDKTYTPTKIGPKLTPSPKKQRGRVPEKKYKFPLPQWIVRAQKHSVCGICKISYLASVESGHFTKKENFNWVICKGCKAYMHFTCIKKSFRCTCGVAHLLGNKKMM